MSSASSAGRSCSPSPATTVQRPSRKPPSYASSQRTAPPQPKTPPAVPVSSSKDTDWSDIARTAAIQALAATVGASLLDVAVRSLQQGDAEHARFREQTRAEIAQVA